MTDPKTLKARVDRAVKQADKDVIAERMFYDDVSSRLYVTLFKGSRKTDIVFTEDNGSGQEPIDAAVKEAIKRLDHTPIG
jgi:acetylornithine/succinyldiaminopimelate/putrescine aminotransferase